jgi:hypothetical protein
MPRTYSVKIGELFLTSDKPISAFDAKMAKVVLDENVLHCFAQVEKDSIVVNLPLDAFVKFS